MENFAKYALICVSIIYVLYIVKKRFSPNTALRDINGAIVEGLESKRTKEDDGGGGGSDNGAPISAKADIIKGHTEKQNVNFKDHRTHHEDIITNLYDNIQGTIHKMTAQHSASIARDPMSHESQEKMRYMNTLHDFGNKTLEGSMQDLDKK
jgi:uncharacterized spore protein YtfJ